MIVTHSHDVAQAADRRIAMKDGQILPSSSHEPELATSPRLCGAAARDLASDAPRLAHYQVGP